MDSRDYLANVLVGVGVILLLLGMMLENNDLRKENDKLRNSVQAQIEEIDQLRNDYNELLES